MNSDFKDIFIEFNKRKIKYLVIGGFAVSYYAEPRYTKDIDLWVLPTPANGKKMYDALVAFGAPTSDITKEDFSKEGTIFIFGVAPSRIDIITRLKSISFNDAWRRRTVGKLYGLEINYIGYDDLILPKKKAGRPQDKLDLQSLKLKRNR